MTNPVKAADFNNGLFERMQDMNRSWIEGLREIRQIENVFGSRLLGAKTPTEATSICNEWMTRRLEAVAKEHRAFTNAWFVLLSDLVKSNVSSATGEQKDL
jgi:hypothetical protein